MFSSATRATVLSIFDLRPCTSGDSTAPTWLRTPGRFDSRPARRATPRQACQLLGAAATDCLWTSVWRKLLSQQAIYKCVIATSEQLLGQPLSPHVLRDCAVTSLTEHESDNLEIATQLLGHATPTVTRKAYDHGRMIVAHRQYVQNL